MNMTYEVAELLKKYETFGKIIIGVDFDDTIFPLNENDKIIRRAEDLRELLRRHREKFDLCLWTVADKYALIYKLALMKEWDLEPDYINKSPYMLEGSPKPYFNLLFDDNAGLDEAIKTFKEFINVIENE